MLNMGVLVLGYYKVLCQIWGCWYFFGILILFPLDIYTVSETAGWFDNSVSVVLFALEELLYCLL